MRESEIPENGGTISFSDTKPSIPKLKMSEKKPYFYGLCPYYQESCSKISEKMQNDFQPILTLASIFGISFPTPDKNGEVKAQSNKLKRVYDAAINIIAVIDLVITVSFGHNFALSNAMMITYAIKYTGALLIRLNLLKQCSKIPALFEYLSQLYIDVSSSAYKTLKPNICFQCAGIVVLNVTLFLINHLSVYYESRIQDIPQLSFLGHNVTNNGTFNFVTLVFACYSLNFPISTFTVSISIFICVNVHIILRRVIRSYGETLTNNLLNNLTKEELTRDFVKFRKIVNGINQADEVISFCTFFAYVTCISCFFYSLSSFLMTESIAKQPFFAVELLSVFLFSNFIFLTITCSASKVSTAVDNLKKRVSCMSEIVMKKNLSLDFLLHFMILIENIKSTNVGMTGWGMFTITRGFVLSTIGVMITYGMILFQFG